MKAKPYAVEEVDSGKLVVSKYLMPLDDAVKFVRNVTGPKVSFAVHITRDAPTVNEDGSPTGKYFQSGFSTYLNLSRSEAVEMVTRMKNGNGLESRGARFPIEVHLNSGTFQRTTVWLG